MKAQMQENQVKPVRDAVAVRRIPDFYLMLLAGVENILRKSGPDGPIIVAFWLNEDGGIADMGFNRMDKLKMSSIQPLLRSLLEDGVPGGPDRPVDIAGSVLFMANDENPGVIVSMRTNTLEVDRFAPIDRATNTISMEAMDPQTIRRIEFSSTMAH